MFGFLSNAGDPFTFTMTSGPNTFHVLDGLTSSHDVKVMHHSNGSVTQREGGATGSANFEVGLGYVPIG